MNKKTQNKDILKKVGNWIGLGTLISFLGSMILLFVSMTFDSQIIYVLSIILHRIFTIGIILIIIYGVIILFRKIRKK